MGSYCMKCDDKVEAFEVVETITELSVGGIFSTSNLKWQKKGMGFCDNEECELYGIVVVRIRGTRPSKKPTKPNPQKGIRQ